MDWETVRYDPTYPEPLDPEIIPLCDALNAAGFRTTSSCCGHGVRNPAIWFEHSADELIEEFARFVISRQQENFLTSYASFKKEVFLQGYEWSLHLQLTNVFGDTSIETCLKNMRIALDETISLVNEWIAR